MKNFWKLVIDIFWTTFLSGIGVLSALSGAGIIRNAIRDSELLNGLLPEKED